MKKDPKMNFRCIPTVLQDLVCAFAWKNTISEVDSEVEMLLLIKSWNLHRHFVNKNIWSTKSRYKLPTPLLVYDSMKTFGSWERLFDWYMVDQVLERFDFRFKKVRQHGSRKRWS